MFASFGQKMFEGVFKRKPTVFAYIVFAAFFFEVGTERITDTIWENTNQGRLHHHTKSQFGKWVEEEP